MPSSSRIFTPLLALMMVADARAADPAKFTTRAALTTAVKSKCVNQESSVGNLYMMKNNQ